MLPVNSSRQVEQHKLPSRATTESSADSRRLGSPTLRRKINDRCGSAPISRTTLTVRTRNVEKFTGATKLA
jgi:hypothetical protein